ncbi:MAG: lipoyl synthase [Candidatus Hydrothermarchaeaceae archaeon]
MKNSWNGPRGKPPWLKIRLDPKDTFHTTRESLRGLGLKTVCQEAHCPNVVRCWNRKTATFMLMGDVCTRSCGFCAGKSGIPGVLDPNEPRDVRRAAEEMGLRYVVITSVARDDLPDGGAGHFRNCIEELKKSGILVEALISDFSGNLDALGKVGGAGPQVICHNIETVKRLQKEVRDRRFDYETSLRILEAAKEFDGGIITKSSIMVGLGERGEEVIETVEDLRAVDVDILTIGQYLRPSPKHIRVGRYLSPKEFEEYEEMAKRTGFKYVASSPFVRSSYKAEEAYLKVKEESF